MLVLKECGSLQDISFDFVNCFYGDKLSTGGKEQTFLAFRLLLKNGWTIKEMYTTINDYISAMMSKDEIKTHPENPSIDIINIFNNKRPSKINLLDPTVQYYHNHLRIYPQPAKAELDYNTGIITKEEVEYFLEYRGSLTIEDLCMYFLSKKGLYDTILADDMGRIYGSISWVYKKFQDAELILYMIDAANINLCEGDKAKMINPSNIQDYYSEAIGMRDFKKNECSINGDIKVVTRKRVLSNRSWLLDRQKEQTVLQE